MQSPGALVANSAKLASPTADVEASFAAAAGTEDLEPAQIVALNVGNEMGIDIASAQSRVPKPIQGKIDLWSNRVKGTPSPAKSKTREPQVAERVLHVVVERAENLPATGMFPASETPYVEAVLSGKAEPQKDEQHSSNKLQRRTNPAATGGGADPDWVSENEFENTPNHLLFPCQAWQELQEQEKSGTCFLHLRVRNSTAISVLSGLSVGSDPLVGTHVIDLADVQVLEAVSPSDQVPQVPSEKRALDRGGTLHAAIYMTRNFVYSKEAGAEEAGSTWLSTWLFGSSSSGGGGGDVKGSGQQQQQQQQQQEPMTGDDAVASAAAAGGDT